LKEKPLSVSIVGANADENGQTRGSAYSRKIASRSSISQDRIASPLQEPPVKLYRDDQQENREPLKSHGEQIQDEALISMRRRRKKPDPDERHRGNVDAFI
jgi:hypothetical protein